MLPPFFSAKFYQWTPHIWNKPEILKTLESETLQKWGMDLVTMTAVISSKFYGTLQYWYAIYYPIVIIDCTRWGQIVYYMITQETRQSIGWGLGLVSFVDKDVN